IYRAILKPCTVLDRCDVKQVAHWLTQRVGETNSGQIGIAQRCEVEQEAAEPMGLVWDSLINRQTLRDETSMTVDKLEKKSADADELVVKNHRLAHIRPAHQFAHKMLHHLARQHLCAGKKVADRGEPVAKQLLAGGPEVQRHRKGGIEN